MPGFEAFFRTATGYRPYGYQARIARDGLPDLVRVPTGGGKTGVILAWLWRRLHGPDQAGTPRRLMYVLPPGELAESVSAGLRTWLLNLDLASQVALHVAGGGRSESTGDWREDMHLPAIVVGDADLLVSKALNRGYGTGPAVFPIDFALAWNGAQWIVDEPALCPRAATTLRQLAVRAAVSGTAEPFAVTALTALTAPTTLTTKDPGGLLAAAGEQAWETVETGPERSARRAARPAATRTIRRAAVPPGDYQALAAFAAAAHRPGTLTLVMLDQVTAAQQVYRQLRSGPARTALLHARFRGVERTARQADILADPAGLIVVSAGEAAAGLDLTASVVLTEAAPWPSMVRRAGRANRAGALPDAALWWLPRPAAPPAPGGPPGLAAGDTGTVDAAALDAARAELTRLEGLTVTAEDLLAGRVPAVTGRDSRAAEPSLAALFDTSPVPGDPAGLVESYLRGGGEPDVELAWVTWTAGEDGAPDPEVRYPAPDYRCRVGASDALALAAGRTVWRFDRDAGRWRALARRQAVAPHELLLVDAADGGYDQETGFDPRSRSLVPDSPQLLTPAERAERVAAEAEASAAATAAGAGAGAGEPGPSLPPRKWQSLTEHSEQVRDQAAALLAVLAPSLPPAAARAAVLAGYLHDTGKAHPVWQDALCALAGESDAAAVAAGRPWAKSGTDGRLEFAGGVVFRHELASLLLIDGPLRPLLADSPDPDLTRYLVLAHHGLLRVQVRERGAAAGAARVLLGLEQGATSDIPPVLGQPAATLTVDLGQFHPGGDRSWTGSVRALLDRYGPFTLAYLETIVRMADWRASGGRELASARR